MTSHPRDKYKRERVNKNFHLPAFGIYLPSHPKTNRLERWTRSLPAEVRGNNVRKRSCLDNFSHLRSTFAKPQGSETQRGFVYSLFSIFSRVQFSWVQLWCDWLVLCCCTADHTSVIFTIIIEICCSNAVISTRSGSSLSTMTRDFIWFGFLTVR